HSTDYQTELVWLQPGCLCVPGGSAVDVSVQHLRTGPRAKILSRRRLQTLRLEEPVHAQPVQPDDHARRKRTPHGSHGRADEGAAAEVQVEEATGRTSLRDHQAVVWLHPLFAQGPGESADGMEPDHPGLQPQARVEPGELRETDGGGGLNARRQRRPAKNEVRSNL